MNFVSDDGISALSEAVKSDFRKLAEVLIKKGAKIFYDDPKIRDSSPFFKAIVFKKVWAIEMFCDHGVDVNSRTASGQCPLIYAITN